MNILAVETSGPMLSLALRYENQIFEYAVSAGFQHARLLLPGIDYLFQSTGIPRESLDLIACAAGPGSFTGLRIGMATARGLSLARNIPLVLLSSLRIYAAGLNAKRSLAVLDARKGRFYAALADEQGRLISDEKDADLACIRELLEEGRKVADVLISGPGAELLYQQLTDKQGVILDPYAMRPRACMMLGPAEEKWRLEGPCSDEEGPHYLRESDAVQQRFYSS